MGQLIEELLRGPKDVSSFFSTAELLTALLLSFVLCFAVGLVYRATHRGVSYSQSFVVTTVIVGVIVSVIMLIIGSNIARAFTLVGALSIIRFRNAVKETRDVGFIFLSMAIGMACGTRFYGTAIIFTAAVLAMIYLLHAFDVFARPAARRVLRVHLPGEQDPDEVLGALLHELCASHTLLSMETVRQGIFVELVYDVVLAPGTAPQEVLQRLRAANGNAKVALTHAEGVNL